MYVASNGTPPAARKAADVANATTKRPLSVERNSRQTSAGRAAESTATSSTAATNAPIRVPVTRPDGLAEELSISSSAGALETPLTLPFHHLLEEAPVDRGQIGHDAG